MAVPTDITDLSTTVGSNSPLGSETVGTNMDNYIRAVSAIVKQNVSKGSDIASSGTISIPNEGNYFVVTGTTGITAINNTWNGRVAILKFSGIVTLTDSAGLILFGANITTAAGDVLAVVNESSGVYRAISLTRISGEYITAASTHTLTNKTIVAANNTITTAASGNLAATELDSALAELDAEKVASINYVVKTSTGTYSKPSNLLYIDYKLIGGGGGGGGVDGQGASTAGAGGGGGAGGYSEGAIAAGSLSASETVTIGAAGAGGVGAGGNNGGTGGTTSLGSHAQATGGAGGEGRTANTDAVSTYQAGGAGGTGSLGDFNTIGACGGIGADGVGSSTGNSRGGRGGDSLLGGGANSVDGDNGGVDATGYGGGGGGASVNGSTLDRAGGAGKKGVVIIKEYLA